MSEVKLPVPEPLELGIEIQLWPPQSPGNRTDLYIVYMQDIRYKWVEGKGHTLSEAWENCLSAFNIKRRERLDYETSKRG